MDFEDRVRLHAAMGDAHRLRIVDALRHTDLSFSELAEVSGLGGNALAHHLDVLEGAGLIRRRASEGDRRKRYVHLVTGLLDDLAASSFPLPRSVLFVCTHNSARSQFAAAWWRATTDVPADSAGTHPAEHVHPSAVRIAGEFGLDLSSAAPRSYEEIARTPDLIISVCDRARESKPVADAPRMHWSIPDPVREGTDEAFRSAFEQLRTRIDTLTRRTRPVDG